MARKSANLAKAQQQGQWGSPVPHSTSTSTTPIRQVGARSGRLSAPLQKARLSGVFAPADSSDDESSSSESGSPFQRALRPGTPPKPSILRQIRRSSTTNQVAPNQAFKAATTESKDAKTTRKLWGNFELRSSRNEYNLSTGAEQGQEPVTPRRALNSTLSASTKTVWATPADTFDLATLSPAGVPLTSETCVQVVEELVHLANFTKKMYQRASYAGNPVLCTILSDGVAKAYASLASVAPPLSELRANSGASMAMSLNAGRMTSPLEDSTTSLQADTMAMVLQQYSDKLMNMMQQKIGDADGQIKSGSNLTANPTTVNETTNQN